MNELKDAALRYAELGFRVIPLVPGDKNAWLPDWSNKASSDPEQIKLWWDMQPESNIGILGGGPNHLVIIDADNDDIKGKFGSDNLREWQRENGDLPDTATVLTPGGGVHYYYYAPIDCSPTTGRLPAVDIRGAGSYAVAPPSIHPNGGKYEWEVGTDPETLPPVRVEMDSPVMKLARPKKPKEEQVSKPIGVIESGKRTDAMVRLVSRMVDIGLSDDAIINAVREENLKRCDPPLTDEELSKTVFPALTRGWAVIHPYTEFKQEEGVYESLADVVGSPPPMRPVLIENVLRCGHKAMISGPSKAGKSFALLELAVAIATGSEWFGDLCSEGRVLYINMEIDRASLTNRILNICELKEVPKAKLGNIQLWHLRGQSAPINKLAPKIISRAQAEKDSGRPFSAIIVDPLYKVMDGDENSNSDIGKMVGQFDRIAQDTGASVLYAHHFAKGYAGDKRVIDRAAGAGAFARDPDAVITLTELAMSEQVTKGESAWRAEYVLREFPFHEPVSLRWSYPLHSVDHTLDSAEILTSTNAKTLKSIDSEKRNLEIAQIHQAANKAMQANKLGSFTLREFCSYYAYDITDKTAASKLEAAGFVKIEKQKGMAHRWALKGTSGGSELTSE